MVSELLRLFKLLYCRRSVKDERLQYGGVAEPDAGVGGKVKDDVRAVEERHHLEEAAGGLDSQDIQYVNYFSS